MTASTTAIQDTVASLPSKGELSTQLNTVFRVSADEKRVGEFTLVELESFVSTETQENFSLTFRAASDVMPEQRIYLLEHDELKPMELFLVPIKCDESGLYFEAVFNYFKR